MAARKRAKGAGRKSKGPYHGNSEMLGVRIRPEVRGDLDRIAKEHGFSLSQEVQRALDHWIKWRRGPCGPALVNAIFKVVEQVKAETGQPLDDDFTAAAVRAAIDQLLVHLWPPPIGESNLTAPARLRDRVAGEVKNGILPPEFQSFELTPAGAARRAAGFVIVRIENAASEDLGGLHPRMLDPEGYWEIRQALGSGFKRSQQRLSEAKGDAS